MEEGLLEPLTLRESLQAMQKRVQILFKKIKPKPYYVQLFFFRTVHSLKWLLEVEGASTLVLHMLWEIGKTS